MKQIRNYCLLLVLIWLLSGCNASTAAVSVSTADQSLPEQEAVFTWWGDRAKPFGQYEYTVTDEAQALTDLADKFQVTPLPSFDQAREILKKGLLIEGVGQEPEEYRINAYQSELNVSSLIKFKDREGKYTSYGTVSLNYCYLDELQKVKLATQSIEIHNYTATQTYNGCSLEEMLTSLGQLLLIENLDQLLQEFQATTKNQEELKGRDIVIYEDYQEGQKARTFGKSFGVKYNEAGILELIYATTKDYRR